MMVDIKDKVLGDTIMRALTSKLMTVSLSELPPLVHQMLKLSAEHNSTLLFSTLSKYFIQSYNSVDDNSSQETSESISKKNIIIGYIYFKNQTLLKHDFSSIKQSFIKRVTRD